MVQFHSGQLWRKSLWDKELRQAGRAPPTLNSYQQTTYENFRKPLAFSGRASIIVASWELRHSRKQKETHMSIAKRIEELMNGDGVNIKADALAAAMKKHNERQVEEVSERLVRVMKQADEAVITHVAELKRIRKTEKASKQRLVDLGRAVDYFKETGNPLPLYFHCPAEVRSLLNSLGEDLPAHNSKEYKVPNDWQPKTKNG